MKLLVLYLAILGSVLSRAVMETESKSLGGCLDATLSSDNCFTSYKELTSDLALLGGSIKELAIQNDAGLDNGINIEEVPQPSKPLTLKIVEDGVESGQLDDTPLGYLTRYGYMRGIMAAQEACSNTITKEELTRSIRTFFYANSADSSTIWSKMSKERCSEPDVTFDEEGRLSEDSRDMILEALKDDPGFTDHASRLRRDATQPRRKRRYALSDTKLDLLTKDTYSYRLHQDTVPSDGDQDFTFHFKGSVDQAFTTWSEAVEGKIKFINTADQDEDIRLSFVADDHDDFVFSGDELAHAPFPGSTNHGNIHYRANRQWLPSDTADTANFLYTTVHELGHWLGLKHSTEPGAVMQAIIDSSTVSSREYDGKLGDDDILGIKMLYGGETTRCPASWHGWEGLCYRVMTSSAGITWDEAQLSCEEDLGANLVYIKDSPMNQFVLKTVSNGRSPYWMGRKSTDQGWVNGEPFDWYPSYITRGKLMRPKSEKCLVGEAVEGRAWWRFVNCKGKDGKVEHYVCEKLAEEFKTTAPPTTPAPTTVPPTERPVEPEVPCQTNIRAALRRGNYLYVFGTDRYFKYYYTSKRPQLMPAYPREFYREFPGIPNQFQAVVTNPYNHKMVYFIVYNEVYEWKVSGKNTQLEEGKLILRRDKPKEIKKFFKTANYMRGATTFDRNSILLFGANGEVGRWHRDLITANNRTYSKAVYTPIEKWDYFDLSSRPMIDGVTQSYFNNFLMFIRNDEYFLMKKTDGKTPGRFRRNLSSDFDKLEICDMIAPLIDDYPAGLDPEQALEEEEKGLSSG